MNVAHFTDSFHPRVGGVEIHVDSIVRSIPDVDFTVITDAIRGTKREERYATNCLIKRFGPPGITTKFGNKILFPERVLAAIKRHEKKLAWVGETKPDLLHVHGFGIAMDTLKADGLIGSKLFSSKISFKAVGTPKLLTMHGLFNFSKAPDSFVLFQDKIMAEFDNIICVDRAIKTYALKMRPSADVNYIPNFIDTDKFSYVNVPPIEMLRIAYIGRPDPLRGFDVVKELAANLPAGIELTLVLASEGGKKMDVPTSKGVRILWDLSQDEVCNLLGSVDVVLNPLRIPVASRVALEAMARGRVVITSKNADNHPVEHGETGLLFDGTLPSLLNLTQEVKEGKNDFARIGRNARAAVEREFSYEVVIPKLRNIYEKVVKTG